MLKYDILRDKKDLLPESVGDIPFSSNEMHLKVREWVIVSIILAVLFVLIPFIWIKVEQFEPGKDYRLPYEMSEDCWLFERYCESVCAKEQILVIGDSVIWGQYVEKEQTLSHHLNGLAAEQRFANMGMDGLHPVALFGLLKYYGGDISGKVILIHFNPLWLSSSKHDLQTEKEFSFNHPKLVPQFIPEIPCYKASISARISAIVERNLSFLGWVNHLNLLCFADDDMVTTDFSSWVMVHPYDIPFKNIARKLQNFSKTNPVRNRAQPVTKKTKYDLPWVDAKASLQWRYFTKAVKLLQERDNRVFVLCGPFNEHILEDESLKTYNRIKKDIEDWLLDNNIDYHIPPALPEGYYADASHPLGEGYALLAIQIFENPFWPHR